ncbi:uncharacterized protein TRIADDRAFT_53089 [Trichoplax adhaerens]|uniref:Uncharacterized protein n=1 Tax=Trichoplax adhaerens TaxID=10228 RepID=B3RN98_TRIAD|nr:predicted protein [Trichoplax adhaerens]EDV27984.1 predicted protein [Trichoplax adhaerens]|eukprot:XP_002109818.1 predicted protein [Trichoplax adhaerens]
MAYPGGRMLEPRYIDFANKILINSTTLLTRNYLRIIDAARSELCLALKATINRKELISALKKYLSIHGKDLTEECIKFLSSIRYKWISFTDGLEVDINGMRVDKLAMTMAEILQCYRTAAGIFTYVNDNVTDERPNFLDETILEKLHIQSIAEAQIITVIRAIVSSREVLQISKLSEDFHNKCIKPLRFYKIVKVTMRRLLKSCKLGENLQDIIARTQKKCLSRQVEATTEVLESVEGLIVITPIIFILPSERDQVVNILKDRKFLLIAHKCGDCMLTNHSDREYEDQKWPFCCRIITFAFLLPPACALSIAVCLSWLTLFLWIPKDHLNSIHIKRIAVQCFCLDNVCYEDAIAFCRSLMMAPYHLLLWAVGTPNPEDSRLENEESEQLLLRDAHEKTGQGLENTDSLP